MKKTIVLLAASLVAFTGLSVAWAAPSAQVVPDIPFSRFTLPNGLTVVVHEDHKAPVVAVSVWYHVGSADEPKGKTGFAHLFEHLMFSGSENHKGTFFQPFELAGATDLNGTTSYDRTNYFETVPTTALDMALWMESDRMGHLLGAIGQKELDTQRGVVQNEKRQRENVPYGRTVENILLNTFPANHPYHHTVIGSMADLDAASLADVKGWFHDYYGAANTTLVLAGDITVAQARAKVEKYFGDIPSGPPVPRQQPWTTPLTTSTRGVQHDQVAQTRIERTWVIPGAGTDDSVQLDLASTVLGGGKTSRLYQRLVYQDQLADDVSVSIAPYALAGQFDLTVDVKEGVDPKKVEAVVAEEWKRFLADGPTADELERAKVTNRAGFVRGLEKVGDKASLLASGQVYRNDPSAYKKDIQRSDDATIATVLAASRKWLTKGDYTLTILPASEGFDPVAEDKAVKGLGVAPDRPAPIRPAAQAYTVTPSQVDRSKGLPTVDSFPSLTFPALQRGKLKNGIEVVLAERHTVPVTQIKLLFDGGYAADEGRKPGTASFTAAMMNESTTSLDSVEITRQKERLGAIISAYCSLDTCSAGLNALNADFKPSLQLFADVVRHPAFKADDIERVRRLWVAGIAQEKTEPTTLALRALPPLLYGKDHAYGIPLTGSGNEEAIRSLTVADLKAFQTDILRPDNARILVAGDTTLAQILPELEAAFGDWKAPASPIPARNIGKVAVQPKPRVFLINRTDAQQSLILAGFLAPSTEAKDALALGLANDAFGGSFTSRLNMNLREEKRWAYGANSFLIDAKGQRPMLLYAPVQTDKTADSAAEILKEVQGVVGNRPLTEDEISKVRAQSVRALPGSYETISEVLSSMGGIVVYGRPDDYVQTLVPQIEAVHQKSAQSALAGVVSPSALTWVIVGDLRKIEAPVRALKLGDVQIIDADGKPVH
ncbi:putative Zn-dependent peptidase [Luteibacter sp. Sphag1AF]|uniref:M16 family metallopeptidase n=1 Tax=Luteibacter sp. Sphag1AF TaxID=2587031 RepID=UPI0016118605|nr:pitrilysin family protein [Luteibacter sp. Sphag1AF]MBB3226333.1 putative Zn-dependent peptidase [Luteibacter sp. Sphag1AF]